MAGIQVIFFDAPPEGLQHKYAVIISLYHGQLIWCRHRERSTWEIPGGHIEPGETALEAAARELREETGASGYTIRPICWYSAFREENQPHSVGLLCLAEVHTLETDLHNEIAEVQLLDGMPSSLTYPEIQPVLLAEAQKRGFLCTDGCCNS